MNAPTAHPPSPAIAERRSLQPLRDPARGTPSEDPAVEGPPLPPLPQDDGGLYWTVLHCTYDCTLKRR